MGANLLRREFDEARDKIQNSADYWQNVLDSSTFIPSDAQGQIRSLIGLSKLLVSDKFSQFSELLESYEARNKTSPPVHLSDLQGLWDVLRIQIEDTYGKYDTLIALKECNWKLHASKKVEKKGPPTPRPRRYHVPVPVNLGKKHDSRENKKPDEAGDDIDVS